MMYEDISYITKERDLDIHFLLVDLGEKGWRAYIFSEIDYKQYSSTRSDTANDVHYHLEFDDEMKKKIQNYASANGILLPYGGEVRYMCWTAQITSLQQMHSIAAAWCEITAYYIKNGGNFANIQDILSKKGII